MRKNYNPVIYFEIPVNNIERAIKFYSSVFNLTFEKDIIDNNEMAIFPFHSESSGISGALAKGEIYNPSHNGCLIYFYTNNIKNSLNSALKNGGKTLFPVTSNGEWGWVAEFEDSEGNRIGLHQPIK